MLRAMIDTMVFDRLVDDQEAFAAVSQAVRHSRLALLTTPVQEAQIAAVPDPRRRKQLRSVPREAVPVAGGGFAGRGKHAADEAIAETALARCDVLVTEDRRLTAVAVERGLTVWDVAKLLAWVDSEELCRPGDPPSR